jgi:hypothetical protein
VHRTFRVFLSLDDLFELFETAKKKYFKGGKDQLMVAYTRKKNIPCHQVPHTSEVYQQSVQRKKNINEEIMISNYFLQLRNP